jgi:Mce-associated membrane protein
MAGEHEDTAHHESPTTDAEAEDATQEAGRQGRRAAWRRNPFLAGACVLLVAAVAAAAVFGGLWASASLGGDAHYSQVRNHVLQVAKGAAVNFTSVDYRHVDQYKKHAEESTTGTLHKTLDKSIGNYTDKLSKAKLVVRGSVMQAALSTLDTHTGKASALVVLKTVTTRAGKKPSTQRLPMTLKLTRVDSGDWKVSGLGGSAGSSALPGK